MFTNEDWSKKIVETGKHDFEKELRYFDYFLVQFEKYRKLVIRQGVAPEKVKVLGSTRFCKEWREIYLDIVPILSQKDLNISEVKVLLRLIVFNLVQKIAYNQLLLKSKS